MGNRIISFKQDPIQKRLQENPLEVFLDVSLNSHYVDRSLSVTQDIPKYNYIALKLEEKLVSDDIAVILDDELTSSGISSIVRMFIYSKDYQNLESDTSLMQSSQQLMTVQLHDSIVDISSKLSVVEVQLSAISTDISSLTANILSNLSSVEHSLSTFDMYSSTFKSNRQNDVTSYVISNDTYELERLVNVKAIRNSILNIFSWIPGERVLLPEFGCNLRKLLYEGITNYNVEQIIAEIKHVITKWEPRILIVSILDASTVDDHENNTVHIKVIFVIPGLSDAQFEYDYVQPITKY